MATRYGWEKAQALLKKGWTLKGNKETDPDKMVFGDPRMVDNITGKEYTPYEAEKIQQDREKACVNEKIRYDKEQANGEYD